MVAHIQFLQPEFFWQNSEIGTVFNVPLVTLKTLFISLDISFMRKPLYKTREQNTLWGRDKQIYKKNLCWNSGVCRLFPLLLTYFFLICIQNFKLFFFFYSLETTHSGLSASRWYINMCYSVGIFYELDIIFLDVHMEKHENIVGAFCGGLGFSPSKDKFHLQSLK